MALLSEQLPTFSCFGTNLDTLSLDAFGSAKLIARALPKDSIQVAA
jgi:hypothetical protein